MQQIVECVPNFSNGRNPEIYNAIADIIRSVNGIQVLDVSADADHNRTVITFVGDPTSVEEAAFRAIGKAATLINLDTHVGEHPRIGATDVCPFIPVKGITIKECVQIAERLAKRVGEELGIATYLYGAAATSPARKKLSAIRRGEYEGWKAEVATVPKRQPDFGPAEPKSWGATVIGVRPFLIAYNIYLNSNDVEIADKISRSVRFIGGGLRFVQAKGFLVDGQAQVSMNLTNYEKTPIYHVQEMVRREAARYGLSITKAELIGLSPQKALTEAAKYYLQLNEMEDSQILENQLSNDAKEDNIPHAFLDETASKNPTPGGGSVAALAGALGAALAQMVAGLTVGRKKYAGAASEQAQEVLQSAGALREQLTQAIAEDAAAFNGVMAAFRSKGLSKEEKGIKIEVATLGATEVPLRVANLSSQVANLAYTVAKSGNVNAVSDAAAAVLMARASVQAAGLNVKINAVTLQDRVLAKKLVGEVEQFEESIEKVATAVLGVAAERGGF